jgi:nucleoside-diphosphate-sugar epimerase
VENGMGTHLVIGGGPVGTETARRLAQSGHDVIVVTRSGSGPDDPGIRKGAADASSVDSLLAAAPAADALYNCVNPEYHRWAQDWPPLASAFLTYAERTGAVLATCSNLYGYGPVTGPLTESLPLAAEGTKGRVRATMWLDAQAQHEAGRIRATEVRGSDYICAGEQSLVGSSRVVPRILAGKSVSLIGSIDVEHSWTSPVDVARLLIEVAANERAWGRAWHVPTNAPRTQHQVIDDLADAAGVPRVRVTQLSPFITRTLGLFNPAIRELEETAYQRDRSFVIDDSAARAVFHIEPTPWPEILQSVIAPYRKSHRRT